MTTTTAIASQGTLFKIKIGSAFTAVRGFTDFGGIGGGSATVIDTSDLSSTAKEKVIGLPDEGQVKISLNYIPDDAGQVGLEAARNERALTDFEVILPDTTQFAFSGYVLMFDKSGKVDDKVTASVTVEITGAVTKSKAV